MQGPQGHLGYPRQYELNIGAKNLKKDTQVWGQSDVRNETEVSIMQTPQGPEFSSRLEDQSCQSHIRDIYK